MKLIKALFFTAATMTSFAGFADGQVEADGYDVMIESVIVRPLSFAGLVAGSALFVGLSPLTAIATIPAPHNAFELLADTLVVKPAKYTFVRPVGEYGYNEGLK